MAATCGQYNGVVAYKKVVSILHIKDLGEFGLIDRLTRSAPVYRDEVVVGIGDDAAVVRVTPDMLLVASSDMLVDGVHFLRHRIPAHALGHKLLAISLSDMAAMGATPKYALVSIAIPADTDVEYLQGVYEGLGALAERFRVSLIGGDTVSSDQLVLDLTIIGEVAPKNYRLRSGARPGDLIAVTGQLGSSAAGLAWELADRSTSHLAMAKHRDAALLAHYWPEPRLTVAKAWCEQGLLTALNDISDGLASEMGEICSASHVGARVYAGQIPVSPCAIEVAELLSRDVWDLCLNGGEDYELLATLPPSQLDTANRLASDLGISLSVIGEVRPQNEGVTLVTDGLTVPLRKGGYDHFAHQRR